MFTLWDRLLGTYQAQPAGGHERMGIGMRGYEGARMFNAVRLPAWPIYEKAMGTQCPREPSRRIPNQPPEKVA